MDTTKVSRRHRLDLGDEAYLDVTIEGEPDQVTLAALHSIGRAAAKRLALPVNDPLAPLRLALIKADRFVFQTDNTADRSMFEEARAALLMIEEILDSLDALLDTTDVAEAIVAVGPEAEERLSSAVEGLSILRDRTPISNPFSRISALRRALRLVAGTGSRKDAAIAIDALNEDDVALRGGEPEEAA